MNPVMKFRSRGTGRIARNPHFWAIILISLALGVIYYGTTVLVDAKFPWFIDFVIFEIRYDLHGSLFFIPFLYAAIVFWWRGALITWLCSFIVMLPPMVYLSFTTPSLVRNIFFALAPLMVVLLIILELRWRERERETLAERETERQTYMSQIFRAQEDERQRIAQELHDDTTQTLLVIANRAQSLVSDDAIKAAPEAREQAEWIRDTVLQVSENVRRLSLDLRPSILDNIGLVPALRWLVDRLNQENGIDTRIVVKGAKRKPPPGTDVIIFRIVQEALSNIRRHSEATKVWVALEFVPEFFRITVQDNGRGFPLPETMAKLTTEGKLGLIGMQQRAKFLDGTVKIHSEPGKGTSVSLEVKG